jgi:hypothetical protein
MTYRQLKEISIHSGLNNNTELGVEKKASLFNAAYCKR